MVRIWRTTAVATTALSVIFMMLLPAKAQTKDLRLERPSLRSLWLRSDQGADVDDASEAEYLAKLAIANAERLYGPDDVNTLLVVLSIANLYQSQGRYEDSERHFVRALTGFERLLGREDPDTLEIANKLGLLYQSEERYIESEILLRRVLSGYEKVLGRDHPRTLATANNLAATVQHTDKLQEAELLSNRVLTDSARALGETHPNILSALENLASVYSARGAFEEAEELYKRSLTISQHIGDSQKHRAASIANSLIYVSNMQGKNLDELKTYLAARGISTSNVCIEKSVCTPVRIYFGTNRNKEGATFGKDRSEILSLGHAVVTIPRAEVRKRGEIRRPTWYERNFLKIPDEGDPSKHFTILRDGLNVFANPGHFLKSVREQLVDAGKYKDHAVVFVHGYNVPFDAALYRTAQIAYDLGYDAADGSHIPFGTPFLFSWPSFGDVRGYLYDQDSARLAVDHLRKFIELISKQTGIKQVNVIAHSMGNIVLLRALKELHKPSRNEVSINQIILAAPDVDMAEFEQLSDAVVASAKGVTLYASSSDWAIVTAREIRKGAPRAGDVLEDGPLVIRNIYSIDITAVNTDALGVKHSEYAESKILLNDINRIFSKAENPPDVRNINFMKRQKAGLEYWRYAE